MAIDTEQELKENQETIDSKLKLLKKNIKTNNKKLQAKTLKQMKKYHDDLLKHMGVGTALGSRFGGSIYKGSVYNAAH